MCDVSVTHAKKCIRLNTATLSITSCKLMMRARARLIRCMHFKNITCVEGFVLVTHTQKHARFAFVSELAQLTDMEGFAMILSLCLAEIAPTPSTPSNSRSCTTCFVWESLPKNTYFGGLVKSFWGLPWASRAPFVLSVDVFASELHSSPYGTLSSYF